MNMIANPLLAAGFLITSIAVFWFTCCIVLILIILIQKGRGGGLGGAFGGGMASGILGSKTGDFLTWVTIVLVGIFLVLSVVLVKFYKPAISDFDAGPAVRQKQPQSPPPPLVPPTRDVNSPGG